MLLSPRNNFCFKFTNFNISSHWEQFLKIPGNSLCCDCENPDPRWASINLGITLCIACSGVHRSLGVHYSKVRSLTLDAWEPEIIKVMMELGNQIVNKVYEANVDKNIQRATANCDSSVRESWIKAKYVDKRFVLPIGEDLAVAVTRDEKFTVKRPVVKRWSVRKLRRRPKSKPLPAPVNLSVCGEEDSSSTASNQSGESVLFIGKDISDPLPKEDFALSSDQESTGGEDNNLGKFCVGVRTKNLC